MSQINENTALQLRDNAQQMLMSIKSIEGGVEYLNKVRAIEVWAKAERKDAELQNIIAEQKIRTQRVLGRLIQEGQEQSRRISVHLREKIHMAYKGKCAICDYKHSIILEIHHIVPVCCGGGKEEGNLILICPNCHALFHKIFDATTDDDTQFLGALYSKLGETQEFTKILDIITEARHGNTI
jgi:5-methylcytosine-specific restriction endonuclease McrA